jgi:hypothetical protein
MLLALRLALRAGRRPLVLQESILLLPHERAQMRPMRILGRQSEPDIEVVDGEICWDPEAGPVGSGPHAPRPDEYTTYEGRDGKIKVVHGRPRKTDDGKSRLIWDDDLQKYVSVEFAAAKAGERTSDRPVEADERKQRIYEEVMKSIHKHIYDD